MKLLTVGKDISELIEQIKWSGDTKQVARTIQFTIAKNKKDKDFPTVVIDEGAEIIMQDDSGMSLEALFLTLTRVPVPRWKLIWHTI